MKEVTLTKSAEADKDIVDKASDKAKKASEETVKALRDKTGQPDRPAASRPLESIVDDRFDGLRRYVRSPAPGKPAPIDGAVAMLADLYSLLSANKTALTSKTALPTSDLPTKIKAEAARVPEPIRSLLAGSIQRRRKQHAQRGRQYARQRYQQRHRRRLPGGHWGALSLCQDQPPRRHSRRFRPGFCSRWAPRRLLPKKSLAVGRYLDSSLEVPGPRWRDDGAFVDQLVAVRAARRRFGKSFSQAGGRAPALKLEFKPLEMDAGILQFVLDIDGQVIKYSHGPQVATPIQWPGPRGSMQVRLQLSPARAGGSGRGIRRAVGAISHARWRADRPDRAAGKVPGDLQH